MSAQKRSHHTVRANERAQCFASPRLASRNGQPHIVITGGAGFIGANLADRLLTVGHEVVIFDNCSRRGSETNLAWLNSKHGSRLHFEQGDVRDSKAVSRAVRHAFAVFHFAAQVAVTDSLTDPWHDFDVNAGGTLNVLEAIRQLQNPPAFLFTSTNKVYGALADIALRSGPRRYSPDSRGGLEYGISEQRNLDFHSPYGCSKGAADQYTLDYSRTFRIPAVVFRMSCIYGPHQNGTEDQGWVAHFLMRANEGAPIRVYGDGKQVRDILFIEDLLDAFELAMSRIEHTAGHAFNIGGGARNTVSLLELIGLISELRPEPCRIQFSDWRQADQRYYVSDTRKFGTATGWTPRTNVFEGLELLESWLSHRQDTGMTLSTKTNPEHRPYAASATASSK